MYTTLIRPNKQTRLFNWLVSSFTTNIFYKFIHILKTFYQQMQYIHLAAKRERYKLHHSYNLKLHFIARKYTRTSVLCIHFTRMNPQVVCPGYLNHATATETVTPKKSNWFDKQNNNSPRAAHNFVHFFVVTA